MSMPGKKNWPSVKLGEVLTQYKEYIDAPEPKEYPKLSVKLYGKGVILDSPVDGSTLKMKRHQLAKPGQVILSEIWGKKGAIGFVPGNGGGALCTSHFFLFDVQEDKLESRWLQAIFDANFLQKQLDEKAFGTTGYAAVRPKDFLASEIPLPPLSEQRRIVSRLDELIGKATLARQLRTEADEEAETLLVGMAHRSDLTEQEKLAAGWRKVGLASCFSLVDDQHKVAVDGSYPNLGIYSFGKGLFHKPPIEGISTSAKTLRRVAKGQFIYNRLFAFEGAYGMVSDEYDGHFVSTEYPTFSCDPKQMRVEFLISYFKHPSIWRKIAIGSKGLGDRRQRVQPDRILAHELWLPPLPVQDKIAEIRSKIVALKPFQESASTDLSALVPSLLDKAFKGEL